jgi:hypothetical protein
MTVHVWKIVLANPASAINALTSFRILVYRIIMCGFHGFTPKKILDHHPSGAKSVNYRQLRHNFVG